MNRLLPRLLVATALCVALAALCLRNYYPPLAQPLDVNLVLERGTPGQSDPVIATGRTNAGDFLLVQYVDATHVIFAYDSWAQPGHFSDRPVEIVPGQPLPVRIEMPSIERVSDNVQDPPGRLRITCRGQVVLDLLVHHYIRQPHQIYLGENPLGGSSCGPTLHGKMLAADGRELRGAPHQFFTFRDRLAGWLRCSRQVWLLLLLSVAVGAGWIAPAWFSPAGWRAAGAAVRTHRWFVVSTATCALPFAWMVTTGKFEFAHQEDLGAFYDYQALSLLHGRLDVPNEAIGGEAFVFEGKLYGYFGPTPALLRIPFVLFQVGFGELSRTFLVGYLVAALLAAYLLLQQAVRLLGREAEPPGWAVVLFILHLGFGSTLFYLGSRAYVFHEAILCGAAFALFSCYFALRHLNDPTGPAWLWALLLGLLSLHARPPTGLFALVFLGCVHACHLLAALRRRTPAQLVRPVFFGLLCVLGIFTFNGLSYLKFKTFEGAPLRYSRPYDAKRLATIEGKNFHAANVPYGVYTYVLRPNFRIEPHFPWFYVTARDPGRAFPDARIDLPDHTLALPFSMPGLFLLSTLGGLAVLIWFPSGRSSILVAWVAVVPMSLAMFAAIATAQRYTGDWVPFLGCAGALGLAALLAAPVRQRVALGSVLALLTIAAMALTFALTLHYQRETVWGVDEGVRKSYQELRRGIDAAFGVPSAPPVP